MNPSEYLGKICEFKRRDIQLLYQLGGIDSFKCAEMPLLRASFYEACQCDGLSLIAELKKASPSKGIINSNFDPIILAKQYVACGASCLSILTEQHYFLGDPKFVSSVAGCLDVPIIRKDFILDVIQVYEAKALGASAILLIKAILSNEQAQILLDVASMLGLDVLMEIHSKKELEAVAKLSGIKMCGVNNRDLNTFEVDVSLAVSLYPYMRRVFGDEAVLVAESGYNSEQQLQKIESVGFDAVLIGEGLITHKGLNSFFNK